MKDPYGKIGRNEPCPCGSGRKYKSCCQESLEIANSVIAPFAIGGLYPFAKLDRQKDCISIDAEIEKPVMEF
jgi:hypothetical protein